MADTVSILSSVKRYQVLRLHRDATFANNFNELRKWKRDVQLKSIETQPGNSPKADFLQFYISEVFPGVDLHELTKKTQTGKLIEKFFTGTEMLTVLLEFNALTFEINERLTEQLFGVMGLKQIDANTYVEACHQADVLNDMEHRLDLLEDFAVFLDEAIRDPVVIAGLKITKIPARVAGFRRIHKLIASGFKLARKSGDPRGILEDVIQHERQVIANVRNRIDPEFFLAESDSA
jgi:hypothetical protein